MNRIVTTRMIVRALTAALIITCSSWQHALAEPHHTFWEIKGTRNKVYLLGSIHMLKSSDSALSPEILRAYRDSRTVIMELSPAAMTSGALQSSTLDLEMLPENQSLLEVLGPELYPQFQRYANARGFDTDFMSHFQPWYAALTFQRFELAKAGYSAESGVEMQLIQPSKTESKTIIGLETIEDQLGLFAHLSMKEQRDYLRTILQESDADADATKLAALVSAWQQGDAITLEKILRKGFAESPTLYSKLVTERNRKWLPKFIELLNRDENCFIVVGALHLIGRGGMLELLKQQGFRVVQR